MASVVCGEFHKQSRTKRRLSESQATKAAIHSRRNGFPDFNRTEEATLLSLYPIGSRIGKSGASTKLILSNDGEHKYT
ncbi:MAG: hypothetical protein ACI8Z5_000748 [Lentimonas sp.]|jgi:hypothetical protein